MKRNQPATLVVLVVALLLLGAAGAGLAQTSAGFNLEWHAIGSGGGEASSANYRVNGTVGQGIASPPSAISAAFVVSSGYWFAGRGTIIYLPLILRN
jgi:hypothetical protein